MFFAPVELSVLTERVNSAIWTFSGIVVSLLSLGCDCLLLIWFYLLKRKWEGFPGEQWLRIHLAIQGTWVRSLVRELRCYRHTWQGRVLLQPSPDTAKIIKLIFLKSCKKGREGNNENVVGVVPGYIWTLPTKVRLDLNWCITQFLNCVIHQSRYEI